MLGKDDYPLKIGEVISKQAFTPTLWQKMPSKGDSKTQTDLLIMISKAALYWKLFVSESWHHNLGKGQCRRAHIHENDGGVSHELHPNGQPLPLLHAETADPWSTNVRISQGRQFHQLKDLHIQTKVSGQACKTPAFLQLFCDCSCLQ